MNQTIFGSFAASDTKKGVCNMKRVFIVFAIVGVAVLALSAAGFAYAQSRTPMGPFTPSMWNEHQGFAPGQMHRGYPGFEHGMMGSDGAPGLLESYMHPVLAEALELTPEVFEARHEAGETFWQIAEGQGYTPDEARELMLQAREDALAQAVTDALITQEQADWMASRMSLMEANGYGPGTGTCDGEGFHGPGARGTK
jgi:hypothetical protein